MHALEFNSVIDDDGVIYIPRQYLENISSPVRVILLMNEKTRERNNNKQFSAMKLKTNGFKFDRDIANE